MTPQVELEGSAAFRYLRVKLLPGTSIWTEAGSMVSMSPYVTMKTTFNGGFFRGLIRKFLGGESLFINQFSNGFSRPLELVLSQGTPGDIVKFDLKDETMFLEPGAYIASTEGVALGIRWAGLASFIGGEGLFKLSVSGSGSVWVGGYGQIMEKQISGEYIVDSGHLIAYQPSIRLKTQLSSGIFGSFFSGEGFVTRVEGSGKVYLQSRSLAGMAAWANARF